MIVRSRRAASHLELVSRGPRSWAAADEPNDDLSAVLVHIESDRGGNRIVPSVVPERSMRAAAISGSRTAGKHSRRRVKATQSASDIASKLMLIAARFA